MEYVDMTDDAPEPNRPFQFTLRTLLLITAVVALCLGLIMWLGWAGVFVSLPILAGIAAYRRAWGAFALVLIVGVLLTCTYVPRRAVHITTRTSMCQSNLKQLSLALLCYHNDYGSFPPAYVADNNGKPMHSWRVLILPYIERRDLYEAYDFNEPWDGPNNSKLHGEAPALFFCCGQPMGQNSLHETNYAAVIGRNTAWRGDRPVKLSELTDGDDVTILLVEVKDSGINWMEPRDLQCPPMPTRVNPSPGPGISSYHPGGASVAFADGSVYFLPDRCRKVAAFLTINGGEKVSKQGL